MKKIFKLLLCVLMFVSVALMGCRNNDYDITKDPDNDEDFKFEDYDYKNPDRGKHHWRDLEVDDGFIIDGVLDETEYEQLKPFSIVDESKTYKLDTKVYFGKSGMYIAAEMTDSDLYFLYAKDRPIYMNSSVIFTLDTLLDGNILPSLSVSTVQIRVGVNGDVEQWMGRSYGGYEYSRVYFPAMARTMAVAKDSSLQSVNYLANYTATNVKGYNVEVYVPWTSLNLTEKPEYILVRPEFNKTFDMLATESGGRINVGHRSHKDPEQFVPYGHNGPSSDFFMPSNADWKTNSDGSLSQSKAGDRKLFASDINGNYIKSSKYYFETMVTAVGKHDDWPKFGIVAGQINNNTYFYTVDAERNLTNNLMLAVNCAKGIDDWQWPRVDSSAELGKVSGLPSYKDGNYIKLAVMRDGQYWYFFAEDKLVDKRKDIRGFDATTESYVGIMTMNSSANFKELSYALDDEAEIILNGLISTLKAPSKTVYNVGDTIDLTGGKIERRDFDNFNTTIATLSNANIDQYDIRGFDTSTVGTKKVTLTVNGVEYSYQITVR